MLTAAMNPCPCGYYNSVLRDCVCTPGQIHRYLAKISGPLLDRIDLHIEVPEVEYKDLTRSPDGECSSRIAARVTEARRLQMRRFQDPEVLCNAQMGPQHIKAFCKLDDSGKNQLEDAIQKLGFSARAYDRILKVARTISDLAGSEAIQSEHVAEAIQYRSLDRNLWNNY
jgi:magnesium chelatase family protein